MKYKCTREIRNLWMLILRYIELHSMHYMYNITCVIDLIIWRSLALWNLQWTQPPESINANKITAMSWTILLIALSFWGIVHGIALNCSTVHSSLQTWDVCYSINQIVMSDSDVGDNQVFFSSLTTPDQLQGWNTCGSLQPSQIRQTLSSTWSISCNSPCQSYSSSSCSFLNGLRN